MISPSQADFKKDLEQYVSKATILVHSPETTASVQQILTNDDPVQRVSDASVMVMQAIDSSSRKAGIEIQDSVKVVGCKEIVELVIELGEAASKFKLTPELHELALSVTVQDYVKSEMDAGRIHGQKLKVALDAEIRQMPPKYRKEAQQSMQRIPMIARKYAHGRGIDTSPNGQAAPVKSGMINSTPPATSEPIQ